MSSSNLNIPLNTEKYAIGYERIFGNKSKSRSKLKSKSKKNIKDNKPAKKETKRDK